MASYDPASVEKVREIVGQRTAVSETWENSNGSFTTKIYDEPHYFRPAGSPDWLAIDTSLVADTARPGWVRSAKNEWTVRFGPLGPSHPDGGVEVTLADGQVLAQRPLEVTVDVDPVVDGSTVTYAEVWSGVDLVYTVTPSSVKEDVVVRSRPDRSNFAFAVDGVTLGSQGAPPGALVPQGAGAGQVAVAAPEVLDRRGRPVDGSALPSQRAVTTQTGSRVDVSVDPAWIDGLPDTAFPVIVDPTMIIGSYTYWDFASNGWNGTYSGPRVGNSQAAGDVYWRSVAYFDYTSLLNSSKDVLTAFVDMSVNGGTTTGYGVGVQGSTTCVNSYNCLQPGWTDVTTVDVFGSLDVTSLYDTWVATNVHNGHLWFGAAESPGLYNYKSLSLSLEIVWNTLPGMTTPTAPSDQQVLTTTRPTLTVNAVPDPDPDGDEVWYAFRIATGADGESGAVANSGWMNGLTSWTVPAGMLRDGVTYTWRVFTYDGKSIRDPNWVWTFKVDQRLGAGGPSPMDTAGPVGVNLATGNVTTSVSTPTVGTLGGGIGLSLTYNSQAPKNSGLSGSYYQDWNANKAIDAGEVWNTRVDSQVSFNWGGGAPMPGLGLDGYMARWTGYITMPNTGQYTLGTRSDDGVRVYLDAGNLWRDDWNDQGMDPFPEWANWAVDFQGGVPRAIQVDYYEATGAAGIELWVQEPDGDKFIVPADWLSTSLPGVPDGWTMSAGAEGGSTYVAARVSANGVTLVGGDASTYEYKRVSSSPASGFTPPLGTDDVLAQSPDGKYVVQADDGYTYTFRADGLLESVSSALDDRHPAAVTYNYAGSPARLTSLTDPLSGRSVTLTYGGSNCPTPPPGAAPAPAMMLCRVDFSAFDPSVGGADFTDLIYNGDGRLVRVVNPGAVTTEFAYDSVGGLINVLDPLAADAAAAGLRDNDDTIRTAITYQNGRAAGVTLPEPLARGARPARTYEYVSGSSETRVHVAGMIETGPNLWARKVTFDGASRTLTDTDAAGVTFRTQWDAPDRVLRTTDPAGLVSTRLYDQAGRITDTYGPAPASCFTGQSPNGSCTSPPPAHAHSDYDQGIAGLAATYWNNKNLSGPPAGHATQLDDSAFRDWGATKPDPSVTATEWSIRYTGEITLPTVGSYRFFTWAASGMRVWLDDRLLTDMWTDPSGWTRSPTPDPTYNNTVAGSKHRIRIDVFDTNNSAAMQLFMAPPGGSEAYVPGSLLSPRYGLPTTQTVDGSSGVPAEVTATSYANPHLGLATATTVDPNGLNLRSTTTYENSGAGYLRRTERTLPAGDASKVTYSYWGATEAVDNPCTTAVDPANQAGALKYATSADPDAPGTGDLGLRHETIYDAAGRVAAHRLRGHDGTLSAWECTTYDARGRVVATTDRDGLASSVAYSDPLRVVTTDQDSAGVPRTTTAEFDLLGRRIGYTDELGTRHAFTFDQAGRLLDTTRALSGQPATLLTQLEYDTGGRVWKTHDFGSGSDQVTTYAYDPTTGRPTTTTLPNGVVTTTQYDATMGAVESLTHTQGQSTVASASVTRAASGRITGDALSDTTGRTLTRGYSYDAAGRLTQANQTGTVATGTRSWAYDANSNRCANAATCATADYQYDAADRIVASPEWSAFEHDTWGNVTGATPRDVGTNATAADTMAFAPGDDPHDTVLDVGRSGSLTATVGTTATPTAARTTTGATPAGTSSNVAVTVDGQAGLAGDLTWTAGTGTVTTTPSGTATTTAPALVPITTTATGDLSAQVSWGSTTTPWGPIYGDVGALATVTHLLPVTGNGPINLTLTWPNRPVNPNLALELWDGNGVTKLAESNALSGNTESLSYNVAGMTAYPTTWTFIVKVKAVTTASGYTLSGSRPVTATVGARLVDGAGSTVASSTQVTGLARRTLTATGVPVGAYRLEVTSTDFAAPFTITETHAVQQHAAVRLQWRRPDGTLAAEAVDTDGALSLSTLASAAQAGGWNLRIVNESPGIPIPSWSATTTTTALADQVNSSSVPLVSQSTNHSVTADGPGPVKVALSWNSGVAGYADLEVTVIRDATGTTIASGRSATGSLTVSGTLPAAGTYTVRITSRNAATGTYTATTSRPVARGSVTVALVDASGATVTSTVTGTNPKTLTATVTRGRYRLRTTPSGAGTSQIDVTYPAPRRELAVTYDGHDHATRIDDGTTITDETLDTGGRVLHRHVTSAISGDELEDTWFGYAGPGDSPAYTRTGTPTGAVTTLGPGGAVHRGGQPSTWPLANPHGDLIAITDAAGTVTVVPLADPFGQPYGADPRDPTLTENRLGWLGAHQRYTTGPASAIIRMGARLYDPALGRFLETDPVEGGSCNDYDYVCGDSVNEVDLAGTNRKCGRALYSNKTSRYSFKVCLLNRDGTDARNGTRTLQVDLTFAKGVSRTPGSYRHHAWACPTSQGRSDWSPSRMSGCAHDRAPDLTRPTQTRAHTTMRVSGPGDYWFYGRALDLASNRDGRFWAHIESSDFEDGDF